MQDRIFYSTCFGFGFGVLLRSFVNVDFPSSFLLGLISSVLILFFTLISRNNWGIIASVFILTASIGILRFSYTETFLNSTSVVPGEKILVMESGKIIDEPDIREDNQKLTVEIQVSGMVDRILITTDLEERYRYGDELKIEGKMELPENFITDSGKEFDYINYLKKDGILYVMGYPKIEILSHGHGNQVKSLLFSVKEKFLEKINFAIPSPESLLMGGLILGEKASFSDEMRQKFIDTGTIHIVALSGYNVTIVAEWIMKFFAFLPRNMGFGAGVLGILLFVIMSGGSSTAVRAGIMAVLVLIARATGRTYNVGRALIIAGVLMILFNPYVLVYDVSFQLSFIATVAVIFFAPKIEKYFLWVPERFGLRDVVSVTFSAYIFVLPFVIYKMGNLSLVALPANILVLPFIPVTMGFGFLTSFFGMIWVGLSAPFGLISYWLLHYELGVINFFANIPFASLAIPNFPLVFTLLIYGYFIYRLFWRDIKEFFTGSL